MTDKRMRIEFGFADENPEDHTALVAVVDERCSACGEWHVVDSLGNIDWLWSQELPLGLFGARDDMPEDARWLWDEMIGVAAS